MQNKKFSESTSGKWWYIYTESINKDHKDHIHKSQPPIKLKNLGSRNALKDPHKALKKDGGVVVW